MAFPTAFKISLAAPTFLSTMYSSTVTSFARASGLHSIGLETIVFCLDQGMYLGHYLFMRKIRTRIIERRLYFRPEPTVITRSLFFRIKVRDDWAQWVNHLWVDHGTSGINAWKSIR